MQLGEVGRVVANNVERLRKEHGWTYQELSDRMSEAHRPIPPLGLRKIREGKRRIDVDELFTLCKVLGVDVDVMTDPAAWERYRQDCLRWLLAEAEWVTQ